MPGHIGYEKNERADDLARLSAESPHNGPEPCEITRFECRRNSKYGQISSQFTWPGRDTMFGFAVCGELLASRIIFHTKISKNSHHKIQLVRNACNA